MPPSSTRRKQGPLKPDRTSCDARRCHPKPGDPKSGAPKSGAPKPGVPKPGVQCRHRLVRSPARNFILSLGFSHGHSSSILRRARSRSSSIHSPRNFTLKRDHSRNNSTRARNLSSFTPPARPQPHPQPHPPGRPNDPNDHHP